MNNETMLKIVKYEKPIEKKPIFVAGATSENQEVTMSLMAGDGNFYAFMFWQTPEGEMYAKTKPICFECLTGTLLELLDNQADPSAPDERCILDEGEGWKLEAALPFSFEVFFSVPGHGTLELSVSYELMRFALDLDRDQ